MEQQLKRLPEPHSGRHSQAKSQSKRDSLFVFFCFEDKINDRLMDWEQILARRKNFHEAFLPFSPSSFFSFSALSMSDRGQVLSFSHFLPRVEALQEELRVLAPLVPPLC